MLQSYFFVGVSNVKPSNEDPKPATAVLILAPAGLLAGIFRRLAYSPIHSQPPVSPSNIEDCNVGDCSSPVIFGKLLVSVAIALAVVNEVLTIVFAILFLVELGAPSVKK